MNDALQLILAGNVFALFLLLLAFLPLLLNIVLFFKVWIMTNDTRQIRDILQQQLDLDHPVVQETKQTDEKTKE